MEHTPTKSNLFGIIVSNNFLSTAAVLKLKSNNGHVQTGILN